MIAPANFNTWVKTRPNDTNLIKLIRELVPQQSTPREIEDEDLTSHNRLRECDDVESNK